MVTDNLYGTFLFLNAAFDFQKFKNPGFFRAVLPFSPGLFQDS